MKTILKWLKKILLVCRNVVYFSVFFVLFIISYMVFLWLFLYVMSWNKPNVAEETSPDGKYRVVFQEREAPDWPFGSAHARVILYEGSQVIERFDEDFANDGGHFSEYNYSVYWKEDEVAINFFGEGDPIQRVIPLED